MKDEDLQCELVRAQDTKSLFLSNFKLFEVPKILLASEVFFTITRLDLSNNKLTTLPKELSGLSSLRELWIRKNPIEDFPHCIISMTNLAVIDMRWTKISILPPEISVLPKLYELDWRNTPLCEKLKTIFSVAENDLVGLKAVMSEIHIRKGFEDQLADSLSEYFARDADHPKFNVWVKDLVSMVSLGFPSLEEFKMFVRRGISLFPDRIQAVDDIALEMSKKKFYAMQRETKRKRMAADVDIVLRNIYFDRVERSLVEEIIHNIYAHVKELEDIEFFVKYASHLLPNNPQEAVNGEQIWQNILTLQSELTEKRQNAISSLAGAILQLYPEQTMDAIHERAEAVAKVFATDRFATKRELNSLIQITGEVNRLFPPDFASIDPLQIRDAAKALFSK